MLRLVFVLLVIGATCTQAWPDSQMKRDLNRTAKRVNRGRDLKELNSKVAKALVDLKSGTSCSVGKVFLREVKNYSLKHTEDSPMRTLLQSHARAFLERCGEHLRNEVQDALSHIDQEKIAALNEVLGDSNLERLTKSIDVEVLESFDYSGGRLLNASKEILRDYTREKLNFDPSSNNVKRKNVIDMIRLFVSSIGKPCKDLYENVMPVIKKLRRLIIITGDEQQYKVSSFASQLQKEILRFRYCEDFFHLADSKESITKSIKELKAKYNIQETDIERFRRSITLAVGILIAVGCFALVAYILLKWLYRDRSG